MRLPCGASSGGRRRMANRTKKRRTCVRRSKGETWCWRLPDLDRLLAIHLVAGLALERLRELRHVGGGRERPYLGRRVRIDVQHQLRGLVARGAFPDAGGAQEEALVFGHAVDLLVPFLGIGLERG